MLKIKIVQADFGDCFLLEYGEIQNPRYLLIDGGPPTVYKKYLRDELQSIAAAGGRLDLVVLSHIDEDHVMGLLDLLAEIRQQVAQGEPPIIQIDSLWHNTFSETLGQDIEKRLRSLLQERAFVRSPVSPDAEIQAELEYRSIKQGDDLTHAAHELGLSLNPQFAPHSILCQENGSDPIRLDNLSLTIVGPSQKNLDKLRKKWIEWLNKRRKSLAISDPLEASRAVSKLDSSIPNLSSIMFLVEADGKKVLFTGDGRGDHLLDNLRQSGLLDVSGQLHVDILKVPHHGSARNTSKKFFRTITADKYIISANGKHGNPDLPTLKWIAEAAKEQSRAVEIIVTNETESTRDFLEAHPPEKWDCRLSVIPTGAPAAVIHLDSGKLEVVTPSEPSIQVSDTLTGGNPVAKRAFLVGINNFTRSNWALRGCINDTAELHSLLTTYFGFKDEDIRILHDRDATYTGIQDGLEWLLSDYAGSDVRVFHFSSHGSQVEDDGDDEWEALDEVLIPYDHSWTNPFRDDELHKIFEKIPEHVNFTFIADCCHSGSIQRVLLDNEIDFKPRYVTPPPEIIERIRRRQIQREAESDAYTAEKLQEMLEEIPKSQWAVKIPEFLAYIRRRYRENRFGIVEYEKHVLLAGCEDRQTSADAFIEGMYRGAFTWGMGKAIRESNGDLTYAELIRCASENMDRYEQKPQLECPVDLRNVKIFSPLG
jgi:beta-lactamase superfamily II metal-dependent hydrolase